MTGEELVAPLTAVLFAAGEPQTPEKLCGIFDCGQDVLEAALSRLEQKTGGGGQRDHPSVPGRGIPSGY